MTQSANQVNVITSSARVAAGAGPQVTAEQIVALRRDGFLMVEGLSSPEEIESLQLIYDQMFSERRGWNDGNMFDMVGPDNPEKQAALPQILWPSRYEPRLRQTRLAENARSIAAQILGPNAENVLEHALLKPARIGAATPWHQDDAFHRRGSGMLESISIWMPLQDVTVESGCLQYIRGSNLGPLIPHRSPDNDPRIHGLEMVSPPDLTNCVAIPMQAGDAVMHLSRTMHSAGRNTTDRPRRAYVLGYGVKAARDQYLKRDYPWNLEKQTARDQRELLSLPPIKRTIHRLRRFIRGQHF